MTTRSQARSATSSRSRIVPSDRRLGHQELNFVEGALADFAPDWTVQLDGAFGDEPCLVVMPEDADDELGPTFVLHHDADAFCLDQYQCETYTPIGEYLTLAGAVLMLRSRLDFLSVTAPHPKLLN